MQEGDGLPELMCVPCVLQVSRAFTFKQQCRRSDQTLKSFLGDLESLDASKNDNTGDNLEEIQSTKVTPSMCESIVEEICMDEKFASSGESSGAHLDGELDLSALPPEIESDSFEEEIELSSLPGDSQFSSVADEEAKFVKEDMPNKFEDYFDKIDVSHVVSLADNELQDQSIEEEHFGKFIDFGWNLYCLHKSYHSDNIPADENDEEAKMPSDDFIQDILSDEKFKSAESHLNCTECCLDFDTKEKFDTHMESIHTRNAQVDPSMPSDKVEANKTEAKNRFECQDCHKVFAERKILKRHLKIHSPIKPHACTECDMSFAESSNLSKHMKKHTGELRNVVGKPNVNMHVVDLIATLSHRYESFQFNSRNNFFWLSFSIHSSF